VPSAAAALGPQTVTGGAGAATGFIQAADLRPRTSELARPNELMPMGGDDPLESPSQLKDTWALPGELNQYASLEDIERAASPAAQTAVLPSIPDTSVLDFDLDLNSEVDTGTAAPGTVSGGTQSVGALDFDLGFDQPSASPAMGATLVAGDMFSSSLEATSTRPQRLADDFSLPDPSDLDFEISSEFGERHAEPAVESTVDVDLTATLAEEGLRLPVDAATVDLERTSFDSSLLDFDFELDEKADENITATRPFAPALNLSDIDLDLKRPAERTEIELPDAGPPTEPPLDLDLQQEVATKLELARAYEEMGDKDGARELVEEVLREGSGRQKDDARAILARLS
jgi:pilus assembly protein FimV